jgi:monoamine oxidase
MKSSIVIVGAGAGGLMAALELSDHYDITVLEMQDQPGGRIRTVDKKYFSQPVEDGAEFVHGELPVTLQLLHQAGIGYIAAEGAFYRVIDGRWTQEEEMIEGWDELLRRMENANADMTLSQFLDKYYSEEKYHSFRKEVIRYANGFDLADENLASAGALYDEWKNEQETNFRVNGGYVQLIRYMEQRCREKGCRFIYQQTVSRIEWAEGRVDVFTNENKVFTAQKIIITQPVAVLGNRSSRAFIQFDPEPVEHLAAAQDIGMGAVVKVQLLFSRAFWKEQWPDTGFIISDEAIPTWWTQLPDEAAMLTGWLGGPPAAKWINAETSSIVDMGIRSLAAIFNTDEKMIGSLLQGSNVATWEYAYTYPTPRSSTARALLRTPLKHTIYFCGEALYEGKSPGTVEAALVSARQMAAVIRSSKQ